MTVRRAKVAMISPHDVVEAGITAMLDRHRSRIELVRPDTPAAPSEPDVVLYDVVGLADGGQTEFDRLVNQTQSVVLALGRDQRPDLLDLALVRGADGCFLMSIRETDLLTALDSAMITRHSASEPSILCACPSVRRAPRLGANAGLSGREAEILTWVARGLSNDEIADLHLLSINTVKTYIRSAYAKIGVHTRSQAVLWVLQHGFETQPDPVRRP